MTEQLKLLRLQVLEQETSIYTYTNRLFVQKQTALEQAKRTKRRKGLFSRRLTLNFSAERKT